MTTPKQNPGSLLPASEDRILKPIPFRIGKLEVRALPDEDMHVLIATIDRGEEVLANHPNGYSCYALAARIVAGSHERARKQAEYIVVCGGTANHEAIARCLSPNNKSKSEHNTPPRFKPSKI